MQGINHPLPIDSPNIAGGSATVQTLNKTFRILVEKTQSSNTSYWKWTNNAITLKTYNNEIVPVLEMLQAFLEKFKSQSTEAIQYSLQRFFLDASPEISQPHTLNRPILSEYLRYQQQKRSQQLKEFNTLQTTLQQVLDFKGNALSTSVSNFLALNDTLMKTIDEMRRLAKSLGYNQSALVRYVRSLEVQVKFLSDLPKDKNGNKTTLQNILSDKEKEVSKKEFSLKHIREEPPQTSFQKNFDLIAFKTTIEGLSTEIVQLKKKVDNSLLKKLTQLEEALKKFMHNFPIENFYKFLTFIKDKALFDDIQRIIEILNTRIENLEKQEEFNKIFLWILEKIEFYSQHDNVSLIEAEMKASGSIFERIEILDNSKLNLNLGQKYTKFNSEYHMLLQDYKNAYPNDLPLEQLLKQHQKGAEIWLNALECRPPAPENMVNIVKSILDSIHNEIKEIKLGRPRSKTATHLSSDQESPLLGLKKRAVFLNFLSGINDFIKNESAVSFEENKLKIDGMLNDYILKIEPDLENHIHKIRIKTSNPDSSVTEMRAKLNLELESIKKHIDEIKKYRASFTDFFKLVTQYHLEEESKSIEDKQSITFKILDDSLKYFSDKQASKDIFYRFILFLEKSNSQDTDLIEKNLIFNALQPTYTSQYMLYLTVIINNPSSNPSKIIDTLCQHSTNLKELYEAFVEQTNRQSQTLSPKAKERNKACLKDLLRLKIFLGDLTTRIMNKPLTLSALRNEINIVLPPADVQTPRLSLSSTNFGSLTPIPAFQGKASRKAQPGSPFTLSPPLTSPEQDKKKDMPHCNLDGTPKLSAKVPTISSDLETQTLHSPEMPSRSAENTSQNQPVSNRHQGSFLKAIKKKFSSEKKPASINEIGGPSTP